MVNGLPAKIIFYLRTNLPKVYIAYKPTCQKSILAMNKVAKGQYFVFNLPSKSIFLHVNLFDKSLFSFKITCQKSILLLTCPPKVYFPMTLTSQNSHPSLRKWDPNYINWVQMWTLLRNVCIGIFSSDYFGDQLYKMLLLCAKELSFAARLTTQFSGTYLGSFAPFRLSRANIFSIAIDTLIMQFVNWEQKGII